MKQTLYLIVKHHSGTGFALQRVGSREQHGQFDTEAGAIEAAGRANLADETGRADPQNA